MSNFIDPTLLSHADDYGLESRGLATFPKYSKLEELAARVHFVILCVRLTSKFQVDIA